MQVTDSLDDIQSMGMTVVRAWAFQDDPNNGRPVHYKTGVDASKYQTSGKVAEHKGLKAVWKAGRQSHPCLWNLVGVFSGHTYYPKPVTSREGG